MTYTILFSNAAKRQFQKLSDKQLKERISSGLEYIAKSPYEGKPLKADFKGCRAFRIGDYRIVYRLNRNIAYILYIEHRRSVYR